MKTKRLSCVALFALLLSMFNFSTLAETQPVKWSSSETSKTITITGDNEIVYHYTPPRTGEYALTGMEGAAFDYEICTLDGELIGFTNWLNETTGEMYDFHALNAGEEYVLRFFGGGPRDPDDTKQTTEVSILEWSNKLIWPDATDIKENEKKTVTLSEGKSAHFFFSPSVSGNYCLGKSSSDLDVGVTSIAKAPGVPGPEPEACGEWQTDTEQGYLYRLEKGEIYLVFANVDDEDTVTDTIWIRQGEAPKNNYEIWAVNQTKSVTLKKDEVVKYYYTPAETGRYMILENRRINFSISDGEEELGEEFVTSDVRECQVFDLVAGREYVVCLEAWGNVENSVSSSFCIEKVEPVKSASIYVSLFDKFGYTLRLDLDSRCGGYDGVEWSISDPLVFSIERAENTYVQLNVLKKGKATITAKVGNVSTSMELSSEHKTPIMSEGKTFHMKIQNVEGAKFIPSKSGKYQFTVIPDREMIFHLFGDLNQHPLFTKADFSDKAVFTLNLTAGQTYTLFQGGGYCSVLATRVGGATIHNQSSKPNTSSKTTTTSTSTSTTISSETVSDTTTLASSSQESQDTTPNNTTSTESNDNDNHITKNDVEEVIVDATDMVISFFVMGDNSDMAIDADALKLAADADCDISVRFPESIVVQLDNATLKDFSGSLTDETISLVAKHQDLTDLNANQQKALEGETVNSLLDIELTVDKKTTHRLGGKAKVTLANPNPKENWAVLYVAEDGSIERMDATCGEDITFTTDHFSHYAIVSDKEHVEKDNTQWLVPVIVGIIVLAAGCFLFLNFKKKHSV